MIGALSGFAVVGFAILVGYITARSKILPDNSRSVLSKLAFYVCSPLLLFTILGTTDVGTLFSNLLPVSALASFAVFLIFIFISVFRKQPAGTAIIGALSSGYVNANGIGIPLATFMLGGVAYAAPVILLQLIFWAPLSLLCLDAWQSGRTQLHKTLYRTFKNPIILGSLAGLVVTILGIKLPQVVWDSTSLVGHAAVPLLLIGFGISLHGNRFLKDKKDRTNIYLASFLKLLVMPVLAWAFSVFLFHLDAHDVFVVTVLAAIPTAQNVLNYATEYNTSQLLARDVTFITTFGAIPVLFLITVLLAA